MTENVLSQRRLPSDLLQTFIVWEYESLKHLRSYRFLGSIAIAFAVVMLVYLGPILTGDGYDGVETAAFASNFVQFSRMLIIICATLFGADAIVGEFQNRTGHTVLSSAVRRTYVYAGKFIASAILGLFVVITFYASVGILSWLTIGGVDDNFTVSFAYAVGLLLATIAVTYLISTVMKSTTGAAVLSFFLLILVLPVVDMMVSYAGVRPEGSLTFSAGVVEYVLADPYPVDTTVSMHGMTVNQFIPDPALAAVVFLMYGVLTLTMGVLLFRRRQLSA